MGLVISEIFTSEKCDCANGIVMITSRSVGRCTRCPGTGNRQSEKLSKKEEARLNESIRKMNNELSKK